MLLEHFSLIFFYVEFLKTIYWKIIKFNWFVWNWIENNLIFLTVSLEINIKIVVIY